MRWQHAEVTARVGAVGLGGRASHWCDGSRHNAVHIILQPCVEIYVAWAQIRNSEIPREISKFYLCVQKGEVGTP
jgi:hypothetical protein